jgi:hypothetical protein
MRTDGCQEKNSPENSPEKALKGEFTLGDGCTKICKKKILTFPAGEGRG